MKRVIVIDDDLVLLGLMQRWLENDGYETVITTEGRIGIEVHRLTPADLIITDIFLPDCNGTGLLMEVRDDFPQTRVIVISGGGRTRVDYLELARLLGAAKVLRKPFVKNDFVSVVQSVVC